MLNLDPSKLLIIAVVAIILLGPDRLPAVSRQVGGAWKTFTAYRHRMESQVRESMPDLPSGAEISRLARSPSALLDRLSTLSPDEAAPADVQVEETDAQIMTRAAAAYRPVEALPVPAAPPVPGNPGVDPGLN